MKRLSYLLTLLAVFFAGGFAGWLLFHEPTMLLRASHSDITRFRPDSQASGTPFVLGPQRFESGDSITIENVLATSPNFGIGDKVVVRGRYNLNSQDKARPGLFVTSARELGPTKVSPSQMTSVSKGSGDFQLECEVQQAGVLHVSFYLVSGPSSGGVYFGTREQVERIRNMKF